MPCVLAPSSSRNAARNHIHPEGLKQQGSNHVVAAKRGRPQLRQVLPPMKTRFALCESNQSAFTIILKPTIGDNIELAISGARRTKPFLAACSLLQMCFAKVINLPPEISAGSGPEDKRVRLVGF